MADCGSDQNSEQDCVQFATTMGSSQGQISGEFCLVWISFTPMESGMKLPKELIQKIVIFSRNNSNAKVCVRNVKCLR